MYNVDWDMVAQWEKARTELTLVNVVYSKDGITWKKAPAFVGRNYLDQEILVDKDGVMLMEMGDNMLMEAKTRTLMDVVVR